MKKYMLILAALVVSAAPAYVAFQAHAEDMGHEEEVMTDEVTEDGETVTDETVVEEPAMDETTEEETHEEETH